MHQNRFPQTTLGELTGLRAPPDPLAGLKGAYFKGKGRGYGKGGEGEEREGKTGEGDGGGRDGKGGHPQYFIALPSSSFLEICLPRGLRPLASPPPFQKSLIRHCVQPLAGWIA